MKVTSRKTEDMRIEDEATGEVVTVSLVDEAPGKGRIVVIGHAQTSACYWNNMGSLSTREFFLAASDQYIVGCLDPFGTLFRKIDPKTLTFVVIGDIEKLDTIDAEQKMVLMARTKEFEPISDVNGLQALNGELMTTIYGPMWVNQVNERFLGQHPLYTALFTRVATIRQVLLG
jgi:hypothetical protein